MPLILPLEEYLGGTLDPSRIILLFCQCHKMKVYPPPWIMNQLYERFREYVDDNFNGKNPKRLGEYFGEPKGGNRRPYFKQKAFEDFIEMSCRGIEILKGCFGKSQEDAIGIVTRRMETVKNATAFEMNKGEAALEKAYKKWDRSAKDHYRDRLKRKPLTDEQKLEFLQTFPPDAFTGHPDLESLLKK